MVALEDGRDLDVRLLALKALLDDIRRKFEFAEPDEVTRDEGENLPVCIVVSDFQNVLYQIVAVRVLDKRS